MAYKTSVLMQLGEWFKQLRASRIAEAELEACPAGEVRRTMQELGLSGSDLRPLCCSHPGPSALMPQRLREVGIDPDYLKAAHRAAYQDMERVCATCQDWRACAHDLDKGDVQTGMDTYCLNAPTIDALCLEQTGGPETAKCQCVTQPSPRREN